MASRKRARGTKDAEPSGALVVHTNDTPKAPVNLRKRYKAPFDIFSEREGKLYLRFKDMTMNEGRPFDWDVVAKLRLKEQVEMYLSRLGLLDYAQMDLSYHMPLALEFLCTVEYIDREFIRCRLCNKEVKIYGDDMKRIFGLPMVGIGGRPPRNDDAKCWKELTSCDNWYAKDSKSNFIQDPALLLVHKFLAFNIFGKYESGKVNTNELYLLHCAINSMYVSPAYFIFAALSYQATHSKSAPSLPHLATILAQAYGYIPKTGKVSNHRLHPVRAIDYEMLLNGGFLLDEYTVKSWEERTCVATYLDQVKLGKTKPKPVSQKKKGWIPRTFPEEDEEGTEEEARALDRSEGEGDESDENAEDEAEENSDDEGEENAEAEANDNMEGTSVDHSRRAHTSRRMHPDDLRAIFNHIDTRFDNMHLGSGFQAYNQSRDEGIRGHVDNRFNEIVNLLRPPPPSADP